MEVSNEIKEDIRKTQTELKNAIRVHQMWVTRLQEDENNDHLKTKVKEAEKDIVAIGQNQKRVVDRLRRELELYQLRLKAKNRQVNIDNDNRYIAQQLREHQKQGRSKSRSISLLKPSVLNEIHVKPENGVKISNNDLSDSENEVKSSSEKENTNNSDAEDKDRFSRNYQSSSMHDSRSNLANALNKVKESLISSTVKTQHENVWQTQPRSDSDSPPPDNVHSLSPTPSPPPLPANGEHVSQERFLRLVGLVTHEQKEILVKKQNERRKRSTTSTNRNDFLYGNYDSLPKRKKYNQYPYLQSHSEPPQTRSAKLRKQQKQSERSSREGSPSGSSSEAKGWTNGRPEWASNLPEGLSLEPVYNTKSVCHGCGRSDVPSLLVRCWCGVHWHTGCARGGRCAQCSRALPEPRLTPTTADHVHKYADKLAERKRLQQKNIELCVQLRNLESRAASLKENLDEHHAEKRQLLADQIKIQRNLKKLLDFISQFKETSVRSSSVSETGSENSKSNEE